MKLKDNMVVEGDTSRPLTGDEKELVEEIKRITCIKDDFKSEVLINNLMPGCTLENIESAIRANAVVNYMIIKCSEIESPSPLYFIPLACLTARGAYGKGRGIG